MLSYFYFTTY